MQPQSDSERAFVEAFLARYDHKPERAIAAVRNYMVSSRRPQAAPKPERKYGDVLVRVESLHKSYKRGKQETNALRGISLEVREGEFVALTGPSGSGKSTLLQLIGGLDKASSGVVEVDGVDIAKLSDKNLSQFRNRTIGFVFQFFYLQPFLNLSRNIEVPGMFAGSSRKERMAHVEALLAQVGLSDRAGHLPKELSGGQMQRAAIARALLNQPKLLIADEPTGNLDSSNSQSIIDVFEQIREDFGTTIIMVTHDQTIASRADRVVSIVDGARA